MNIQESLAKTLLLIVLWLASSVSARAAELQPIRIDEFCITPKEPAVLRWRFEAAPPEGTIETAIRDYADRIVSSPRAKISAGGLVELPVELPAGYYEVDFPAQRQRFGLLSLPAYQGQRDPFFAIDSALSWLVRSDETRQGLVKVLRRCGILMSRERLNWAQINPEPDKWDWESPLHYEMVRQACRREGVEVLEMFHGTVDWAGQIGKYPENLAGAGRAWREIARRFSPTWGAMEVWNEPDISFGDYLPADQYVPLVKTFAYTFQGGQVKTPLVAGVFATFNRQYLDNAARNGLLDQVPVISFHTYGRAPGMEELIGRYRQWLGDYGKPSMPLWITECGRPWKRGPQRPPADEDAQSALDIVMKGVESKACGIARYFAFVYPYYDERESNFGMMGREATPLRSMAAYAQFVNALARMDYLGDLACDDPAVQRARVFGDQQDVIAVLYTGKVDAGAAIRLGLSVKAIEGIDGRALVQGKEGLVPIPDGLTYVRLERGKLGDRLRTATPAMRLWSLGAQPGPPPTAASPVVLRYQFDRSAVTATSEGYRIKAESPGKTSLIFRAFNLSAEPQQRTLAIAFSQPVQILGEAAQTVTIPASASVDVQWDVDLSGAFAATGALRATVRSMGGSAASGEMIEIDLAGNPTLAEVLRRYPRQVELPIGNLSSWRAGVSGTGRMTMEISEGAWRLDARFQGGDRWVYPSFQLADDVKVDQYSAIVLRARCRQAASVRIFLWEGDRGVGYLSSAVIPADGQWHVAVVRLDDLTLSGANAPDSNHRLDRDRVRRISIGMNSHGDENALDVSGVYFVRE